MSSSLRRRSINLGAARRNSLEDDEEEIALGKPFAAPSVAGTLGITRTPAPKSLPIDPRSPLPTSLPAISLFLNTNFSPAPPPQHTTDGDTNPRPVKKSPSRCNYAGWIKSISLWTLVIILFLFASFFIPHLYAAFTKIAPRMVPNVQPDPLWTPLFDSPPLCTASSSDCCLTLGPVVGLVTETSARLLFEVNVNKSISIALHPIDQSSSAQAKYVQLNMIAGTPKVAVFQGLQPGTRYRVSTLSQPNPTSQQQSGKAAPTPSPSTPTCQNPLPLLPTSLGGGIGIVRTRSPPSSSSSSSSSPLRLGLVSCNNVLESTYFTYNETTGALIPPSPVTTASSPTDTPSPASPKVLELWRHLAERASSLDMVLHLGDQVYSDSNMRGRSFNVLHQTKNAVYNQLLNIIGDTHKDKVKINDIFDKLPPQHALLAEVVPPSVRADILRRFGDLYRSTWSVPSTRLALSMTSNIMSIDDHDIFDDLNDVPADVDPRSLRRLIIDGALLSYKQYQMSLYSDVSLDIPAYLNAGIADPTTARSRAITILEGKVPIPPVGDVYAPFLPPNETPYSFFSHGDTCFALLDTRLSRDVSRYSSAKLKKGGKRDLWDDEFTRDDAPWTYNTISGAITAAIDSITTRTATSPDISNQYKPSRFLGEKQWSDLEMALSDSPQAAFSKCRVLLVTSSVPFVFLSASVTRSVLKIHDDLLGQWSSSLHKDEQLRLFDALISWRDSGKIPREVVLLGGDVHTGGYSRIDMSLRSGLGSFMTWDKQGQTRPLWQFVSSTIMNSPVPEPLLAATMGGSAMSNALSVGQPPVSSELWKVSEADSQIEVMHHSKKEDGKIVEAINKRKDKEQRKVDDQIARFARWTAVFTHHYWVRERNYGLLSIQQGNPGTHGAAPCVRAQLVRGDKQSFMEDGVWSLTDSCATVPSVDNIASLLKV